MPSPLERVNVPVSGGLSQLVCQGRLRDYYADYSAACIPNLECLNDPECFRQSWYVAPPMDLQQVAVRGYVQTTLVIPAGSFIWGIVHKSTGFQFGLRITDMALNFSLIDKPANDQCVLGSPFYFTSPHPVVQPGNFLVEVWSLFETETALCEVCLAVAERV
jgi:hypothetical protein